VKECECSSGRYLDCLICLTVAGWSRWGAKCHAYRTPAKSRLTRKKRIRTARLLGSGCGDMTSLKVVSPAVMTVANGVSTGAQRGVSALTVSVGDQADKVAIPVVC
jgi:hypothetical protein